MSELPTDCDGCGACCMGQNLLPLSGAVCDEVPRLPRAVRMELERVLMGPLTGDDECPCIWLDRVNGRCKHHAMRPDICREFAVGGEACLRIRKEAGL